MLGALEGAAPDPNDPATSTCTPPPNRDYTAFLKADGLKGARIGIPRAMYYDSVHGARGRRVPRGGLRRGAAPRWTRRSPILKAQGAVDRGPGGHPEHRRPRPGEQLLNWGTAAAATGTQCSIALKYGMKRDFNVWLESLGESAPVKTLTELREWNLAHRERQRDQVRPGPLDISDEMDLERTAPRYEADRARDIALGGDARHRRGHVEPNQLDALLFPGPQQRRHRGQARLPDRHRAVRAWCRTARPRLPGRLRCQAPAPFGVSFTGRRCSEPRLLELAYAFEQASKRRVPPPAGRP